MPRYSIRKNRIKAASIKGFSLSEDGSLITDPGELFHVLILREIDAAAVYVNASTRFTDGFEFGFGAEIGISTQKFHARGPMGLAEITTYKWLIEGRGQVRG